MVGDGRVGERFLEEVGIGERVAENLLGPRLEVVFHEVTPVLRTSKATRRARRYFVRRGSAGFDDRPSAKSRASISETRVPETKHSTARFCGRPLAQAQQLPYTRIRMEWVGLFETKFRA